MQQSPFNIMRTLDVRAEFNPIDCRSLGIIRRELKDMPKGAVLLVLANRFQQREIQAWCGKVKQQIVSIESDIGVDLKRIYVENRGFS